MFIDYAYNIKWDSMEVEDEKRKDPTYLTKNELWDANWLREKYPNRFEDYYVMDDDMINTAEEQFRLMYGYRGKL